MIIDDKLRDDLCEAIDGLMNNYHYNPQGADFCCEFCARTADTNVGSITHRQDCEGARLLMALRSPEPPTSAS